MKELGRHYVEEALQHRSIGFSNLHQLLTDIHEGKRFLWCRLLHGGGGQDGGVNLCHRFTGSELPTFGTVQAGLDVPALEDFVGASTALGWLRHLPDSQPVFRWLLPRVTSVITILRIPSITTVT